MENGIGLSNMVAALRHELEAAQVESEKKRLRFEVEDIELELQIVAEDLTKSGLGIKFWILNPSVEASEKRISTQKLRLKLKVTDSGSGSDAHESPVTISGKVSD